MTSNCLKTCLHDGKAIINIFPLIDTFVQHRTEMGRIMHHNDPVLERVSWHECGIRFLYTT
ncbi:hypothetical protein A6J66_001750 [Yersinia enterocolitica]|nr:hypothetical protein A6J66_001750 [Yersinia enterocolitica]